MKVKMFLLWASGLVITPQVKASSKVKTSKSSYQLFSGRNESQVEKERVPCNLLVRINLTGLIKVKFGIGLANPG